MVGQCVRGVGRGEGCVGGGGGSGGGGGGGVGGTLKPSGAGFPQSEPSLTRLAATERSRLHSLAAMGLRHERKPRHSVCCYVAQGGGVGVGWGGVCVWGGGGGLHRHEN